MKQNVWDLKGYDLSFEVYGLRTWKTSAFGVRDWLNETFVCYEGI